MHTGAKHAEQERIGPRAGAGASVFMAVGLAAIGINAATAPTAKPATDTSHSASPPPS